MLHSRARGGSMLPAIAPGDRLAFRACSADAVEPGQVVLIHYLGKLVTHRLVKRDGACVITRGDALPADDLPVDADAVLGVLVLHRRGQRLLHAGGRHWLRRQRSARWLIQRTRLVHRLFRRIPALATLAA